MKRLILASALLLAAPGLAFAQMTPVQDMPAGVYVLDDSHTSLTWRVNHLGLSNYTARFTKMSAELTFNPANPENSKLVASVDPTSIRTDYPNAAEKDFDSVLANDKSWFNAGEFSSIKYETTKIERTGENTGKMHGTLTMLGVSKPLTLDVTFNGAYAKKPFAEVPALGFSAKGVVKRSEWGMATYVPNIGDDVEIWIETEFHKKP
jgi:polyisoprenoid-binding protein YceI